jgi:hypothetical protein
MKRIAIILIAFLLLGAVSKAQACGSLTASMDGTWRSIGSAPRDGTTIELLQTYGIAPTYGLYKWDSSLGRWTNVDRDPHLGMGEACAFWRPYKAQDKPYIDPTNGAQYTVKYWCNAAGLYYNKETDKCQIYKHIYF